MHCLFNSCRSLMEKFLPFSMALILVWQRVIGVTSNLPPCKSSGFTGCECNFIGACDDNGKLKPGINRTTLEGYAPTGLEIFSDTFDQKRRNLAFLCEGGAVTIMYDCNKRIPLYSAIMVETVQLNAPVSRAEFRPSDDKSLAQEYQQQDSDYKGSSTISLCYEVTPKIRYIDTLWYNSLNNPNKILDPFKLCDQITTGKMTTSIHKGHLVAASYGRGNPSLSRATFTYTNVVPQFGNFNSGQWMSAERWLFQYWVKDYCATHNNIPTTGYKIYIIVGVIPSTFPHGSARPRYFGKSGFSAYMNIGSYRVNVPSKMWTAAGCTFKFQQSDGSWQDGTQYTAFWRDNIPSKEPYEKGIDINQLFDQYQSAIQLFPGHPECTQKTNYVSLY